MRATAHYLLLACVVAGCGEGDLQLKGNVDRVVGETVTLALVQGESVFTGDVSLRSPDATLAAADLQASKKDDRTLSFVIPAGIAAGRAVALAGRAGGGNYEVPLQINRLALTLDDKGNLESWPLSPGTLAHSSLPIGTAGPMALAPGGGALALAAADQVRLLSLGASIKDVGPAATQAGIVALAAASNHRVLVATDQSLILFRFTADQPPAQETISFKDVRALALASSGAAAFVLFGCDTNGDGTLEAACLEQVSIDPNLAEVSSTRTQLDASPGANLLAMTADAKGAVVADAAAIYGIYFDSEGNPPQVTKIAWTANGTAFTAQLAGIDRAGAVIQGQPVDLFAIAEQSQKLIALAAFKDRELRSFAPVALADTPTKIGFGRRTQLFVAFAKSVGSVDAAQASPTVSSVAEVTPANQIVNLTVQP